MFSIADMAVAGAVALLLFGPDQLPKVARRAGQLVRDVQNTSQSFIREMERAADAQEVTPAVPAIEPAPAAPAYHETPTPASHELVAHEAALIPTIPTVPTVPTVAPEVALRPHGAPADASTGEAQSHSGEPAP